MEEVKVEASESQVGPVLVSDIRTELVETAVKFLRNPRVMQRPSSEKEAFLLRKGLTSAEVSRAFQDAGQAQSNLAPKANTVGASLQPSVYTSAPPVARSKWLVLRDIGNAIILVAGATYGLVYLYKKFIAPLIFGRGSRSKSLTESIDEMNSCITKLSTDLNSSMQSVLEALNQMNSRSNEIQLNELKNELTTVKGLLLNSRQFPAPPSVGRPSIPTWQLQLRSEKAEQVTSSTVTTNQSAAISSPLSSSPEIISVEEVSVTTQANAAEIGVTARESSESSETGSADMVEVAAPVSGEDTD